MTFILQLDLDMVKMYHHTKSEVSMPRHSKVITCTDRHTDSMKTLPSHICGLSSIVTESTHRVITIRQNILIFWVTLLLRKIQSAAIQKKKKKNVGLCTNGTYAILNQTIPRLQIQTIVISGILHRNDTWHFCSKLRTGKY